MIMITAQELRALQAQFLIEDSLSKATKYYDNLVMEEAKRAISYAQQTRQDWIFLNYIPLIQPVYGFHYTMFLENSLNRARAELAQFGYRIENISDQSKSNKLFIKISW
jgi:hypothetical protein